MKCPECERLLSCEQFSKSIKAPFGLAGWCNHCYKSQVNFCHRVFLAAVSNGDMIRPTVCSRCDRQGVDIAGHHLDYHHALLVEWLCHTCHAKAHRAEEKRAAESHVHDSEDPIDHEVSVLDTAELILFANPTTVEVVARATCNSPSTPP